MQKVPLSAELFHGAVDLDWGTDGSVQPLRIRLADRELYVDALAGELRFGAMPAGVRWGWNSRHKSVPHF